MTELIDEDFLTDKYDWDIAGITIESPDDPIFVNHKGRFIIEEQIEFDSLVLDKQVFMFRNTFFEQPAGITNAQ